MSMRKIIMLFASILLVCSCGGNSSGNKSTRNKTNYFDRAISSYSTGADGIDDKVVLNRGTKEYQVYQKAVVYNRDWELIDKGHYEESFDNDDVVTCELDNAKVKRDDNEKLGTIFRVKIFLSSRNAQFISIAGTSHAQDITSSD